MQKDNLGIIRFSDKDIFDLLYSKDYNKIHEILCENSKEVEKFNQAIDEFGGSKLEIYSPITIDQESFDKLCQSLWFMPEDYKNYNIVEYLEMCVSEQTGIDIGNKEFYNTKEYIRLKQELDEFSKRELLQLLNYMKYLVDLMRQNKIIWGVGRGSSVSSYVLFLIGVHRINPIKYNIDWKEFLR